MFMKFFVECYLNAFVNYGNAHLCCIFYLTYMYYCILNSLFINITYTKDRSPDYRDLTQETET
ncbi:hypothetical protein T02_13914 [Trichinella nativa]|uniref:Uncharacterized protein n=1 Tax=Trichinella nativa TaxID=6335 RepID=A0A0V1LF96_9BILA|nr:hypothetical protein T02_13914 [Trichinella nativa]